MSDGDFDAFVLLILLCTLIVVRAVGGFADPWHGLLVYSGLLISGLSLTVRLVIGLVRGCAAVLKRYRADDQT